MKKLRTFELHRKTVEEYQQATKNPLIIVLDNIRSLNNIGSIFRTSDAFLLEAIYLCGITATPPHNDIHKTALGAENSVSWRYFSDTHEAIQCLKEQQYEVLAVEQASSSTSLQNWHINPDKKYAIVLGNEVKGVQQSVVDACNGCIEIPQFGTKHSLNVSITAGIVIWDYINKKNYEKQ